MDFTIKKGKHYSGQWLYKALHIFDAIDRDTLSYEVKFHDNCLYTDNSSDKTDVYKLFGFSKGLHSKNSYRVGWNCIDNKIRLYAYCYFNGIRHIEEILDYGIDPSDKLEIKIAVSDFYVTYYIILNNLLIGKFIPKLKHPKIMGYLLYPYVGGNKTAQHDTTITLNRTNN